MEDTIVDVDDIKDQLSLVLRSFAARLDEMKTSQQGLRCGFESVFDLMDRHRDLTQKTKPGKPPSRQTIFLLLCVIDSMKNGPISEKEIKEHIVDKCRIYNIKSTNRGTVAGSNIEVSAACHILAAFGIIESFSENTKEKKGAKSYLSEHMKSSENEHMEIIAEKLLNILSVRWDVSVSKQRADSICSANDQDSRNTIIKQEINENSNDVDSSAEFFNAGSSFYGNHGRQELLQQHSCDGKEEFLDDADMDFVDILLERSDSLMHGSFQNDYAFNSNDGSLVAQRSPNVEPHVKLLENDSFLGPNISDQTKDSFLPESSFDNFTTNEILVVDGIEEDGSESLDDDESLEVECEDRSENNKSFNFQLHSSIQNFETTVGSEETLHNGNNFSHPFSPTELDRDNINENSSFKSFPATKPSTRKSHSTSRVWKLRESFYSSQSDDIKACDVIEPILVNPLWCEPGDLLKKWNELSFELQSKLETEEKLLRKLFSQCYDCSNNSEANPLSTAFGSNNPLQLGTRYLDSHYGEFSRVYESSYNLDSCSFEGKWNDEVKLSSMAPHNNLSVGNKRDLLDEKIQLSGFDLIEKVRKSRRQRGNSIANMGASSSSSATQGSQLNSSSFYLNNMRAVCLKASQSFWNTESKLDEEYILSDNGDDAPSTSNQQISKSRKVSSSSTSTIASTQMSVMELLKQLVGSNTTTIVNNSLVNTIVSGYGQNLAVNGLFPNLSISTLRHYSFPISICSIDLPNNSFVCDQSFIYLPDLIVTTIDIPWKSLVSEFSIIKGDDVMRIHSLSTSHENEKEDFEFDGGNSADLNATPQLNRKRSHSRTFSQLEYISQNSLGCSSDSIRSVMRLQVSSDVVAPSFREIPLDNQESCIFHVNESNCCDVEDTTDEWYLRKHDEVLRNMREKWALMQQLKLHTRRDSFSHNFSGSYQFSGSSSSSRKSYSGTLLDSTRSPFTALLNSAESGQLDESADHTISVNMKRSYNAMAQGAGNIDMVQPVKKRGRPPKLQKMNHMHYGRVTT